MNSLSSLLSSLGLPREKEERLAKYTSFLLKANKKISLTQADNIETWFINHVEDAVRAYSHFETLNLDEFLDCGSGNGIPGLIFAILSEKKAVLCDVDQRKTEFLKAAAFKSGVKDCGVYCGSLLDVAGFSSSSSCIVYRGLGPNKLLVDNFELRPRARHFRFVSLEQSSIFTGSKREKYQLSDNSFREIEIK